MPGLENHENNRGFSLRSASLREGPTSRGPYIARALHLDVAGVCSEERTQRFGEIRPLGEFIVDKDRGTGTILLVA
jgi:hypothetical protein